MQCAVFGGFHKLGKVPPAGLVFAAFGKAGRGLEGCGKAVGRGVADCLALGVVGVGVFLQLEYGAKNLPLGSLGPSS